MKKEVIVLRTCECGCGQITLKCRGRLNRFIHGHQIFEMNKKWKETNPEGFREHRVRMGKRTQELHPNQSRETILKTLKKYPNLLHENGVKVHKMYPNLGHENGKKVQRLYPDLAKENGLKVAQMRKDNGTFEEHQRKAIEACRAVWIDWDYYNEHGTYKSKEPYAEIWTETFKENIRKRDNYKCVVTGMTQEEHLKEYGKPLFVHHWTYDTGVEDPFYFVTVSIPVHGLAHRIKDRIQWIDLFNGIMEEKYCELLNQA